MLRQKEEALFFYVQKGINGAIHELPVQWIIGIREITESYRGAKIHELPLQVMRDKSERYPIDRVVKARYNSDIDQAWAVLDSKG